MQIQGYKKTGLPELPKEWNVVTIDQLCDIKGGKRLPLGKTFSLSVTKYPYIRVVDFKNGSVDIENLQYIDDSVFQSIKNYTILTEDLYFSIAGTIGLVGKIPHSLNGANLTENAAKLCNIRNVTQDYLQYFLNSKMVKDQIKSYIGHVSQPKLALFRLGKLNVFLPPIKEQQKIASILSTVDNLIQKTDKVIGQTQGLKKGLTQRLLIKGIGHTKFKKTELGEVPEEWNALKLGDIIDEIRYGSSIKCTSDPLGTPVLRIPNVVSETLNLNELKYALFEKDERDRVLLKEGDILFVRTNGNKEYVGRTIVFPKINEKYAFASYLIKVSIRKTVAIPQFLVYQLKTSKLKKQILNTIRTSAGQYNLNTESIKSLKIVIPNLHEQEKVISILSNVDMMIQKLQAKKKSEETLKKGLMQQLLTGKIRVKV